MVTPLPVVSSVDVMCTGTTFALMYVGRFLMPTDELYGPITPTTPALIALVISLA